MKQFLYAFVRTSFPVNNDFVRTRSIIDRKSSDYRTLSRALNIQIFGQQVAPENVSMTKKGYYNSFQQFTCTVYYIRIYLGVINVIYSK